MKRLVTALGVLAVVAVAAAVLYFTPVMSIREVHVEGAATTDPATVEEAAALVSGTPLLRVDTTAAARRVAALPDVKQATISRDYPSGVTITIVERQALAWYNDGGTPAVLDASGIAYARRSKEQLAGVPELRIDKPGEGTPAERAALSVLDALSTEDEPLPVPVTSVEAASPDAVVLVLEDGRRLSVGSADDLGEKFRAARIVLTQEGRAWNVSQPTLPVLVP